MGWQSKDIWAPWRHGKDSPEKVIEYKLFLIAPLIKFFAPDKLNSPQFFVHVLLFLCWRCLLMLFWLKCKHPLCLTSWSQYVQIFQVWTLYNASITINSFLATVHQKSLILTLPQTIIISVLHNKNVFLPYLLY